MGRVNHVFTSQRSQGRFVGNIDASKMIQFSEFAKTELFISSGPSPGRLCVAGVAAPALRKVLTVLSGATDNFKIWVNREGLPRAIEVYQVLAVLAVQPAQRQLYDPIKARIARNKLTPDDVAAIAAAGADEFCCVAAQNIAWNHHHGTFTLEEAAAMRAKCLENPMFNGDVNRQTTALTQRSVIWEAARKERQARYERQKRKADLYVRRSEELNGPREANQFTVNCIMQRDIGAELVAHAKPMRGRGKRAVRTRREMLR